MAVDIAILYVLLHAVKKEKKGKDCVLQILHIEELVNEGSVCVFVFVCLWETSMCMKKLYIPGVFIKIFNHCLPVNAQVQGGEKKRSHDGLNSDRPDVREGKGKEKQTLGR